ncbi:NAD(P)/FAD-dependent oxidoreductase [Streptomyces sp. NPDC052040]|uniref:NAD(P)/FAD-dependent oxidoreductase n=1 Tax=Streptomyces sp. NPDC052040 TaxID=3365682 RepID=UPI0037D66A8D
MREIFTAESHDLAVVGTGVIGALTAYYACRREPGLRILLVSHGSRGHGATALSAGFDTPTGRDAAQRELALRSTALFAKLAGELPGLPRRDLPVHWIVARSGATALDATLADGSRTTPVDADRHQALSRVFPGLRVGGDQVLLSTAPMAVGGPRALADLLLDQVLDRPGNTLAEGFRVTGIRRDGRRLELVGADGSVLTAFRTVVAPGPWALEGPVADAARARGARVKKVVAFHVLTPPPPGAPALVFEDEDAFLLPDEAGGRWILSITSPDWDRGPDGPLAIGPHDRALALALLDRHVPGFVPHLTGGRVFSDCFTPGHLPIVDTTDVPGVVMAIGGSGSGYRLAPALAEQALTLLYGRTTAP